MTNHSPARNIQALLGLFQKRIVLIDGATGTSLQELCRKHRPPVEERLEGCNEALNLFAPQLVAEVHASYYEAGADIVETNTFGATPLVMNEYGMADRAGDVNEAAARLAREVAARFSTPDHPRFVAGSMGPTTCALSIGRKIGFMEMVGNYEAQAAALHRGGVDYFLVETCQDTLNLKAALFAIQKLFRDGLVPIPVAVSATLDASGHMLGGQTPESLARTLHPFDLLYVGLNCGAGATFLARQARELAKATGARIGLMPNAGLPDGDGRYLQTGEEFAREILETCGDGVLNLVGGCCGTNHTHIRALSEVLPRMTPRKAPLPHASACGEASFLTGVESVEISEATRPVIAGEKSNALGSKKFRELVRADAFDDAADFARRQLDEGASLMDVAVQQPDRDEARDMESVMSRLMPRTRAPVMLDTTSPQVACLALGYVQGKAIVNSANLENGEERFLEMVRTARRFGAALVVGLIDEKGMAVDAARKMEVARRAMALLDKEGMARGDVYLDTLVFPCASGDRTYLGAAKETSESIRALKAAFPGVRTAIGVSNVSFGLPPTVRPLVTLRFFDACAEAGLDVAIANAAGIAGARKALAAGNYSQELIAAVDALLALPPSSDEKDVEGWKALIGRVADLGRDAKKAAVADDLAALSPEDRVVRCVATGSRDGLKDAVLECLDKGMSARDVLNGVLMKGMDEVGRRFDRGELIVSEVLACAEVLKSAIDVIRPGLSDSADGTKSPACRGKLLLATVKGDVHDIGKNLVSMIFASNGFHVVDLGIKVEDEAIVKAAKEVRPDVVGLSGLLVRSAQQMVKTVKALDDAGISAPVLVGGAALSQDFVDRHISPATRALVMYSRDAMNCLAQAKAICAEGGEAAVRRAEGERKLKAAGEASAGQPCCPCNGAQAIHAPSTSGGSSAVTRTSPHSRTAFPHLPPPDGKRHEEKFAAAALYTLSNHPMLYGHHLGLKGAFLDRVDELSDDELNALSPQAWQAREDVKAVLAAMTSLGEKKGEFPRAVWKVFPARPQGDAILVRGDDGAQVRMEFPEVDGRCLADLLPEDGGQVGLFVARSLDGRALAEDFRSQGALKLSHVAQAVTLSLAEAAAEMTHELIRQSWGLGALDDDVRARAGFTSAERRALVRGDFQGCRVSPGYRACPDLRLQKAIFSLLSADGIGVTLTESLMMQPEASVSGIAFPERFS